MCAMVSNIQKENLNKSLLYIYDFLENLYIADYLICNNGDFGICKFGEYYEIHYKYIRTIYNNNKIGIIIVKNLDADIKAKIVKLYFWNYYINNSTIGYDHFIAINNIEDNKNNLDILLKYILKIIEFIENLEDTNE